MTFNDIRRIGEDKGVFLKTTPFTLVQAVIKYILDNNYGVLSKEGLTLTPEGRERIWWLVSHDMESVLTPKL